MVTCRKSVVCAILLSFVVGIRIGLTEILTLYRNDLDDRTVRVIEIGSGVFFDFIFFVCGVLGFKLRSLTYPQNNFEIIENSTSSSTSEKEINTKEKRVKRDIPVSVEPSAPNFEKEPSVTFDNVKLLYNSGKSGGYENNGAFNPYSPNMYPFVPQSVPVPQKSPYPDVGNI